MLERCYINKGFNYIVKCVWQRPAYLWVKHWKEAIHVHLLTYKLGIRKQENTQNEFFSLSLFFVAKINPLLLSGLVR